MHWQWVGALCTVAATGGWGWLLAQRVRERPAELAALQAALSLLRTEIGYGRTPLPEALARAGQGGPPAVRCLFCTAAAHLAAGTGASAAEAWQRALEEADAVATWTPDDLVELARLGEALGRSTAPEQLRHIDTCAERLRWAEQLARRGLERRARMWLYLGVLAGAALALTAGR
jgi:stage III sporulation protein AB